MNRPICSKAVEEGRWGTQEAEIDSVQLLDAAGQPATVVQSGAPLEIRFRVTAKQALDDVVMGVGIFAARQGLRARDQHGD